MNSTYVIHYLNGNFKNMAKDSRTLPVRAPSKEQAVINVFGGPADRFEGDIFWKWGDKLPLGRVEKIA